MTSMIEAKTAISTAIALGKIVAPPIKKSWAQRAAGQGKRAETEFLALEVNRVIDALTGAEAKNWWAQVKTWMTGALIRPEYLDRAADREWLADQNSRNAFVVLVEQMLIGRDELFAKAAIDQLEQTYSKRTGERKDLAIGRIEAVCAMIVAGLLANLAEEQKVVLMFVRAAHDSIISSINYLPDVLRETWKEVEVERELNEVIEQNEALFENLKEHLLVKDSSIGFDIRASFVKPEANIYKIYNKDLVHEYGAECLNATDFLREVYSKTFMQRDKIFILQAPGGSGKSSYLHALAYSGAAANVAVFYIDIKTISESLISIKADSTLTPEQLFEGSVRGGFSQLKKFRASHVLLLVDGLNEVPIPAARSAITRCLLSIRRNVAKVSIIATDRLNDNVDQRVWRLSLVPLSKSVIQKFVTDRVVLDNSSAAHLLSMPFFLDQFIKSRASGGPQSQRTLSRPAMFESFFRRQLREDSEEKFQLVMYELSRCALAMYKQTGGQVFQKALWDKFKPTPQYAESWTELTKVLLDSGLLAKSSNDDDLRFPHQLLHDYLVARYLSQSKSNWNYETLNDATWHAANQELVDLAVEIIAAKETSNSFLNTVYDWNYPAVIGSIRRLDGIDQVASRSSPISRSFRDAIAALIAHKARDVFASTAFEAERELSYFESGLPLQLRELVSKSDADEAAFQAELVELVNERFTPEKSQDIDFDAWKDIFCRVEQIRINDLRDLLKESPLIGWTTANVLKRQIKLSKEAPQSVFEHLETAFFAAAGPAQECVVRRRRIIYAYGSNSGHEAAQFLSEIAFSLTEHINVREDALRSLLEVGMKSPDSLRYITNLMITNIECFNDALRRRLLRSHKTRQNVVVPDGWKAELKKVFDAGMSTANSQEASRWTKAAEDFSQ